MNVFSAGKRARCYQNWNGIRWNREAVAMEKWSNTAPCSCHALMSRIFFEREKEEKKRWGRKGKVMERRQRLGSEEEWEKMGRRSVWRQEDSEREREIERGIMCTVCLVWLSSSRPDGFHEQDLTPGWSAFCRHITSSFAPPSSILSSLHSTPHPPCLSDPTISKWFANTSLILCHFKHHVTLWIVVINCQSFECDNHVTNLGDVI